MVSGAGDTHNNSFEIYEDGLFSKEAISGTSSKSIRLQVTDGEYSISDSFTFTVTDTGETDDGGDDVYRVSQEVTDSLVSIFAIDDNGEYVDKLGFNDHTINGGLTIKDDPTYEKWGYLLVITTLRYQKHMVIIGTRVYIDYGC